MQEVRRKIVEYFQDEHGDWVAMLQCGHRQHVRHDPPWQNRPWTTDAQGRESMLGHELLCKECSEQASPASTSIKTA